MDSMEGAKMRCFIKCPRNLQPHKGGDLAFSLYFSCLYLPMGCIHLPLGKALDFEEASIQNII